MNKQEQIEKMATILACGRCGRASWDCPEDSGGKCYVKEGAKPTANLLASKSYINGADFVEWLKSIADVYEIGVIGDQHRKTYTLTDHQLDKALQEYLKGE